VLKAGHDVSTTSYPLWTLDNATVERLVRQGAIVTPTGKPGGVLMFHGNLVHGSAGNITPYPRKIVYLTLNSVSNYIRTPTRPDWIAHRGLSPDRPGGGRCTGAVRAGLPGGGGVLLAGAARYWRRALTNQFVQVVLRSPERIAEGCQSLAPSKLRKRPSEKNRAGLIRTAHVRTFCRGQT